MDFATKLHEGDKVKFDDGFDCIAENQVRIIQKDDEGNLYFKCSEGRHYIKAQKDGNEYIGLYKLREF